MRTRSPLRRSHRAAPCIAPQRSLFAIALAGLVAAGACRGGDVASTDAAVDHAYTPSAYPPSNAPTEHDPSAPTAVGGGPTAEESPSKIDAASALNVLGAARCHRARLCSSDVDRCEDDAAREHGSELARCGRGVVAETLSDCAEQIRTVDCASTVGIVESCRAAALCAPVE